MQQFKISGKGAFVSALLPSFVTCLVVSIFSGLKLATSFLVSAGGFAAFILWAQARRIGYVLELDGQKLTLHRGFIFLTSRQVSLVNILSITIMQTPAHALAKTCWLKVNTVGGSFLVGGLALSDAVVIEKAVQNAGAPA